MILGPSLAQISPLWRPEPPTAYHSLNIQIKFHGFHSEMSHPTEVSQVFLSLDMSWPTRAPEPLSGLERAIVHRPGTHGRSLEVGSRVQGLPSHRLQNTTMCSHHFGATLDFEKKASVGT